MSGKLVKDNKCLVDIDIETLKTEIMLATLELSFPVGQPYVTQGDINPSTILGFGTWERVKGKVLVGLDEDSTYFNEIGKEGGETTHTLTLNELPSHSLVYNKVVANGTINGVDNTLPTGGSAISSLSTTTANTSSVGGNQTHNITQPYKVVGYMWIRTA